MREAEAAVRSDHEKQQVERAYRIKSEMKAQTNKERQAEEAKQAEMRKLGLDERKKNDEYSTWLAQDHIRTIAEQAHERRDPSKMHEGAKFSGTPDKFT